MGKIFRNMLFPPENKVPWKLTVTLNHWTSNKLAIEQILLIDASRKVLLVLPKLLPFRSSLIEKLTIVSVIREI